MILQSQEGAQNSRNTAHVKKLLLNNEIPNKQKETLTETSQKQEELAQKQSVLREPNEAETKAPPGGHAAAKPQAPPRRSQRQSLTLSYLKDYYT